MHFHSFIFLDMTNFPFQWACEGLEAVTFQLEKLRSSEEQRGWSGVSLWQQSVSGHRHHRLLLEITWNRAALKSCCCWPSPWPDTQMLLPPSGRGMCCGTIAHHRWNISLSKNCHTLLRIWGCPAFYTPAFSEMMMVITTWARWEGKSGAMGCK